MCGIVGAIAFRNITPVLVEGLRRLEYRGYDSAGVAVLGEDGQLQRVRRKGKIRVLEGDRVSVVLSPYDLTRGRVTYRHK